MRLAWLPDVLQAAGLNVKLLPKWEGRGADLSSLFGIVVHATVTPASVPDEAVARILRDGHSTLKGPLSQLGLDRSGTWWVIADGKCAHNGYGLWRNNAIGIEAFNDGKGEPWPDAQVDAWHRGCAAICRHLDFDVSQVKAHRETDPHRKIDPHGIDMGLFRTRVRALLAAKEDPFMALFKDEDEAAAVLTLIAYDIYLERDHKKPFELSELAHQVKAMKEQGALAVFNQIRASRESELAGGDD